MAEWCRPLWYLWASATLPVSRNLANKHRIVPLSSTLFLPKSLLHCRCVRSTDFAAKYTLMIFIPLLRSIASSWIHIGVKRIAQACCLHHLKNMQKNCKTQLWDEKQNRALFWTTLYYQYFTFKGLDHTRNIVYLLIFL